MISEIKESQNKELLVQQLGVYELRGLARELGIPSPTTKKRDELVSLISDYFKNGAPAETKIQKRGRPYKKLTSLEEIINSVKVPENKGEIVYEGIISFAQEDFPAAVLRGDTKRIEGVVRRSDKGVVLYDLHSNAKVFVADIFGCEKLENGDVVELTAQDLGADNYQALSLSLINGISAAMYQPFEVEHGDEVILNETIPCGSHQIVKGRRNACLISDDLYENTTFLEINDYAKLSNSTLVLLGVNTSYENQIYFKNVGVKYNFTTPYDTNPTNNLNATINGLNVAQRAFEKGENVVLVVSDLGGLLLGLDEAFENDGDHAKESEVIAKKLLSLAGAYSSGQNFTLVMFYNEIDKEDKFLYNDLLRICKKS